MRAYDIIEKKKLGHTLTALELQFLIQGYVSGRIPDYQMAAFAMAVYFQGMNDEETAELTLEMMCSGDVMDLSPIQGIKVDKHSTGGVGDKTTMVIGPIAAACGLKVAKMSGRGLGHTGGTLDKLEAIPGLTTALSMERFYEIVNRVGFCIAGQTGNLVPADKKLYALRDVTATVDSMPLIASSVMSKKLAASCDAIVLDVKAGSGAFMKTAEDAVALAGKMVAIGEHAGRRTAALITNMDLPLGNTIGNALEVQEAVMTLKGQGPDDFTELCYCLAANMLYLADMGNLPECKRKARRAVESGRALHVFADMVEAQGGDPSYIYEPERFVPAAFHREVISPAGGWISHMDTESCGIAAVLLGAGRNTKEDRIDSAAGIRLLKKTGDRVSKGEPLAVLYTEKEALLDDAEDKFLRAVSVSENSPVTEPLIIARVDKNGIARY